MKNSKNPYIFLLGVLLISLFLYSVQFSSIIIPNNEPRTTPNFIYCLPGVNINIANPVYNLPGVIEHMQEQKMVICRDNVIQGPVRPSDDEQYFRQTGITRGVNNV